MRSKWRSELASSSRFHSGLLALAFGFVACTGDDEQGRRPGATDATRIVSDTIEGVLTVHREGLTIRRCGESGDAWVVEAPGADLLSAASELGAGTGDRIRVRVRGEEVTAPTEGAGSGFESAIRAVQWVYLAEDISDCPPGEEMEVSEGAVAVAEILRTGDSLAVERAAARFQALSPMSEADTVQGTVQYGDATSYFTAYISAVRQVVRVEERLDLAEYGARTVEYGLSDGVPYYIREAGTLRDLSPEGAGDLVPRGFEAALDTDGGELGSSRYGPGFEGGIESAVSSARAHLERLLQVIEPRLAERVPTG